VTAWAQKALKFKRGGHGGDLVESAGNKSAPFGRSDVLGSASLSNCSTDAEGHGHKRTFCSPLHPRISGLSGLGLLRSHQAAPSFTIVRSDDVQGAP